MTETYCKMAHTNKTLHERVGSKARQCVSLVPRPNCGRGTNWHSAQESREAVCLLKAWVQDIRRPFHYSRWQ